MNALLDVFSRMSVWQATAGLLVLNVGILALCVAWGALLVRAFRIAKSHPSGRGVAS